MDKICYNKNLELSETIDLIFKMAYKDFLDLGVCKSDEDVAVIINTMVNNLRDLRKETIFDFDTI